MGQKRHELLSGIHQLWIREFNGRAPTIADIACFAPVALPFIRLKPPAYPARYFRQPLHAPSRPIDMPGDSRHFAGFRETPGTGVDD
ncbi:glutathione S-transferase family protein [Paraburkholderia bannensis]|uniref:hypothetical protein n=1 Tax=Paraburkholderia bannensis TaxID=765414 RepID=UPI0005A63F9F|nr:hypothetical protein [Paraburkholderia bannensis]